MKYLLIFALMLVFSIALIDNVSAEPEIFMVEVDPTNIDNQVDEPVNFQGDCSACNEGDLVYFYWNSSIDEVLRHGDNATNINFGMSSTLFTTGDHQITFQVKDNSGWSVINDTSTTQLGVTGRDTGGGDGSITVNFDVTPPSLHLGETARFSACEEMQPEPQPCVDRPDPNLDFNWTIKWEGEDSRSYLSDQEVFEYTNFVEGTHNVSLIITDNSNDEVSNPGYREIVVLPPIPVAVIDSAEQQIVIKEGQALELSSHCEDLYGAEIDCVHSWEIWENKDNGQLQFELTGKNITLNNLTNEMQSYDVMLRTNDAQGTLSMWVHVFVTVNPPNQIPSSAITITPQSLGGMTPEYYQYSNLTFSSSSSSDPDGQIVGYKWWFNNEIVSETATWVSSFSEIGVIFQVRLEVQDDDGVWSTKTGTNFKMIANTPPSVDITISSSEDGVTFTFNSTVSDVEGHIIAYEWFIDGNLNSTEANITWQANQSGSYTVTFRATDDGGLWSEVSEVIEVTIVILGEKNFVATFSSKDIDVGDSLTITFTGTQGSVDHYEIIVNNPDGSRDTHETTENQFTLDFSVAGVYTLDVTVFWTDGIPQEFPLDYFGPTVYVGQDGVPTDNTQSPEEIADSSPLPSVSVVASLIMLSLLASLRRQRQTFSFRIWCVQQPSMALMISSEPAIAKNRASL